MLDIDSGGGFAGCLIDAIMRRFKGVCDVVELASRLFFDARELLFDVVALCLVVDLRRLAIDARRSQADDSDDKTNGAKR